MNSSNKRKMSPPFVRMRRLNLADIDPHMLQKLSIPVSEIVEKSKLVQKKIKGKCKKSELPSCSVKRTKRLLSSPQKDTKLIGKKSCSKLMVNERKNVELFKSSENISCDNANLCNISSDVNEIVVSKTKDKNIFEDDFKMKPITQISSCHCDTPCVPAILDFSVVAQAYKFFKWQKQKSDCIYAKDKLPPSNYLNFEATLPNGSFRGESPQCLIESEHETVFFELDLGAVSECTTTESNYSECCNVKEISKGSPISNSDIKNPSKSRIGPQNLRKAKHHKAKILSINKDSKFKKQHKTETLQTYKDTNFSNSMLDNFQNDNDKICENSEEIVQTLVDESYQNNEVNLSFVSNNNKDSFISHGKIESSCESLEKGNMISMQNDSIESLDNFLNSDFSAPNLLTLNKEKNGSFSIENDEEFGKNILMVDKVSLSNVENTANDSYEFEQVSSIRADEYSSNSRIVYETDILADVLDYEPSEASEFEMSDSELCNGEMKANQIQSGSSLPMIENTFKMNDIQSASKILSDPFNEKLVKDVFPTLEDETTKLCHIMGDSCNKGTCEFIDKNDDECKHFESNPNTNFSELSEHVDTRENKTSGSSNAGSDEIYNNGMHQARECFSFLSENEQSNSCYQESVHECKDEKMQKRSYDIEDDSESDGESSFKRKCFSHNQRNNVVKENNSVDELSQSKVNPLLMKLEEVLLSIDEKCKNGKIDDALHIANQYIPISDPSAQQHIFTTLFYDIMDSFRDVDPPLIEEVCLDKMKSTMEIFYDLNLYNTKLCSAIIIECLSVNPTLQYGQQLFSFCEKNNVCVDPAAIMSYINSINPAEMSLTKLISLLNFLLECKFQPPKAFLKEILNLLFQDKDPSLITKFCSLLHYVDSSEIDRDDLKKFVQLCIEKQQWRLISHLICAWMKKTSFIAWLIETFACHLEDIGFYYEELAKTFFDLDATVPDEAQFVFVQMGVCCLMEAYSKEHYDSAFKILLVFHQHKINYINYQAPMYDVVSYIKLTPNPSKIFVFPFTVAFTAIDICLHLERPKDAYTIFQNVSSDMPDVFDEALKLEIQTQVFHYLFRITMALLLKDPFVRGMKALHDLLSVPQTDFGLKKLNDYSNDIKTAYNKYMVFVLNAQQKNLITDLYSYTFGSPKELFTLDSEVLRGLTVFFVKHNMLEEANKLFLLRHFMDIYNFKQPSVTTPPWEMTVKSSWVSEEIKFNFERFIKDLTPILKSINKTNNFDKWFSVKISIKTVRKVDYSIDCLNENSTILDRICRVLKSLDIQWKDGKDGNSVDLIPETFYKFWFSKYSNFSSSSEIFKVTRIMRISFGESCSQDSSDSECTKQFSDSGSSKDVGSVVTETHHSDNTRLDKSVSVKDSSYVCAEKDSLILQNKFKNNHNDYVQNNTSKHNAYLSPEKTNLSFSITPLNISPKNLNNSEMSDHSSNTDISISPRKAISTSPKIKNTIHYRKTSPKTISTSPQKSDVSLLKSPDQSVVQKQSSPRNTINTSNDSIVSNTALRNADFRENINVDAGKEDTLIVSLPDPNLEISVPTISSETTLHEATEPKPVLKTIKKTILTNKKHFSKCLKYKKYSSTFLKSKSNILKLPPIKITLQNAPAQRQTIRIVKPVSGEKVITKPSEFKITDSQQSSFQCRIPEDVFLKIINFLKSKVMVKRKDLTPQQQQEKALSLGHSFIQENVVTALDKKTMKLLNDYSDDCL